MGTKLKNRRAAESQLGSFIEQLTISEDLVHSIMDAEVGCTGAGWWRGLTGVGSRGVGWQVGCVRSCFPHAA